LDALVQLLVSIARASLGCSTQFTFSSSELAPYPLCSITVWVGCALPGCPGLPLLAGVWTNRAPTDKMADIWFVCSTLHSSFLDVEHHAGAYSSHRFWLVCYPRSQVAVAFPPVLTLHGYYALSPLGYRSHYQSHISLWRTHSLYSCTLCVDCSWIRYTIAGSGKSRRFPVCDWPGCCALPASTAFLTAKYQSLDVWRTR